MRSWSSVRATAPLIASVVALFGVTAVASAQGSATVQGTVIDSAARRPIPGVQVVIAGSSRGALTDEAGRYTIRGVPAGQLTLRAQRLGFAASERRVSVAAGETATADFTMHAVATVLSEVVVTGYGTASRAEVTSAVAQVSGEAIANTPVAGIDAALQGKAPGVQIVQNAGNPGNGITVRVRGASSLSASNQPLWVIDGVPMLREDYSQLGFGGQDLTAVTGLSPDEIESIDILKDASAAAIYGSRGSNGVIQVTPKRGRPGRT
jgi:TonB-dependent SusC/RagA subfamily outer membrane receptor